MKRSRSRSKQQPNRKGEIIVQVISLIVIGFGVGWLMGLTTTPVVSIVITALVGAFTSVAAIAIGVRRWVQLTANDSSKSSDSDKEEPPPEEPKDDEENTPKSPAEALIEAASVLPTPLALIVLGLILGVSVGLRARSHDWFGLPVASEVKVWTDLGLDQATAVQKIFERRLGSNLQEPEIDWEAEVKKWVDLENSNKDNEDNKKIVEKLFEKRLEQLSPSDTAASSSETAPTAAISVTTLPSTTPYSNPIKDCSRLKNALDKNLSVEMGESERAWRRIAENITDSAILREIVNGLCPDS